MPKIEKNETMPSPEAQETTLDHIKAKAEQFWEQEAEDAKIVEAINKIGGSSVKELLPHLEQLKELAQKVAEVEKLLESEGYRVLH